MPSLDPFTDAGESHPLLTVDEAARMMRVGRSRTYALAHEYINSGGTAGMPVIVFGPGCFRVPSQRSTRSDAAVHIAVRRRLGDRFVQICRHTVQRAKSALCRK